MEEERGKGREARKYKTVRETVERCDWMPRVWDISAELENDLAKASMMMRREECSWRTSSLRSKVKPPWWR